MPDDDRHPTTEAVVNALQEATLLSDALHRTRLADLDDLTKLRASLKRAIAALRLSAEQEGNR